MNYTRQIALALVNEKIQNLENKIDEYNSYHNLHPVITLRNIDKCEKDIVYWLEAREKVINNL